MPISTFQPHSRKCTSTDREFSQSSDAEMITPDQKVGDLCTEWKKGCKKRNQSTIKLLMEETRILRQKWIIEDRPMLTQVFLKFPSLRDSRVVRSYLNYCIDVDISS